MKIFTGIIMVAILFSGCAEKKIVEYNSEPFPSGKEKLESLVTFNPYSSGNEQTPKETTSASVSSTIRELTDSLGVFHKFHSKGSLEHSIGLWNHTKTNPVELKSSELESWVAETADLMAATGKVKYARELEYILDTTKNGRLKESLLKIVTPYILTKDVDHIYVNLFYNSTVEYTHSLGGAVKIEQVVDPEKRTVDIHFSMEERRYIELYIRIPEWVGKANVEVKKVYYLPVPGEYCKIAKKWKEGDVANVRFHF